MKPARQDVIRDHVLALCSERCAGRDAGSVEGREARRYLLGALRDAGLSPITQPVPGSRGVNIFARLGRPGGRVVMLAAHYDHIGRAGGGEAYWGADDNAAAVAALLELPHMLRGHELDAEVWIALFDAEEPPHFLTEDMGAMRFVAAPHVPLARIDLAVVLDLVGHAVGPEGARPEVRNTVFALGAEKSDHAGPIVRAAARASDGVTVRRLDLDLVPPLSDYEPLRQRGVPVLFLSCGRWRHYHEVTDTPDRLDYRKIAATAELTCRIAMETLAFSGTMSRYRPEQTARRSSLATLHALACELAETHPRAHAIRDAAEALVREHAPAEELDDEAWQRARELLRLIERGLGELSR